MTYTQEQYINKAVPALKEKFNYSSVMQVPKLQKIVLNIGTGTNTAKVEESVNEITLISGQKPLTTKAKISIASFKLREGQATGTKVTLRGKNMWYFADKLINIALPRTRDFRGVNPNSFDATGNYTMGIKETIIFPEIDYDKQKFPKGMDITFVTSAKNKAECKELLKQIGVPFAKGGNK